MKKIALLMVLIFLISGCTSQVVEEEINEKTADEYSDDELIEVMKKDADLQRFMDKNPDFMLIKETLDKEKLVELQNKEDIYSQFYQKITMPEEQEYLQVTIKKGEKETGFMAVLDMEKKDVVRILGLIILDYTQEI